MKTALEIINEISPNRPWVERGKTDDMIIKAIHTYHAQFEQWISVKERLPECGEDYNVVLELNDGGKPVSGIMEFDGVEKNWVYPGATKD